MAEFGVKLVLGSVAVSMVNCHNTLESSMVNFHIYLKLKSFSSWGLEAHKRVAHRGG